MKISPSNTFGMHLGCTLDTLGMNLTKNFRVKIDCWSFRSSVPKFGMNSSQVHPQVHPQVYGGGVKIFISPVIDTVRDSIHSVFLRFVAFDVVIWGVITTHELSLSRNYIIPMSVLYYQIESELDEIWFVLRKKDDSSVLFFWVELLQKLNKHSNYYDFFQCILRALCKKFIIQDFWLSSRKEKSLRLFEAKDNIMC